VENYCLTNIFNNVKILLEISEASKGVTKMLTTELQEKLNAGTVQVVHASITSEDLARPCTEFDDKLNRLTQALREICPDVRFDFNASGERWRIVLPRNPSADVTELLLRSPLTITEGAHFSGLF